MNTQIFMCMCQQCTPGPSPCLSRAWGWVVLLTASIVMPPFASSVPGQTSKLFCIEPLKQHSWLGFSSGIVQRGSRSCTCDWTIEYTETKFSQINIPSFYCRSCNLSEVQWVSHCHWVRGQVRSLMRRKGLSGLLGYISGCPPPPPPGVSRCGPSLSTCALTPWSMGLQSWPYSSLLFCWSLPAAMVLSVCGTCIAPNPPSCSGQWKMGSTSVCCLSVAAGCLEQEGEARDMCSLSPISPTPTCTSILTYLS